MSATAGQAQESRLEKVGVAVTPTEKRAIRAIAALRGTDESNLVRTTTIAEIMADFERLRTAADATEEVA